MILILEKSFAAAMDTGISKSVDFHQMQCESMRVPVGRQHKGPFRFSSDKCSANPRLRLRTKQLPANRMSRYAYAWTALAQCSLTCRATTIPIPHLIRDFRPLQRGIPYGKTTYLHHTLSKADGRFLQMQSDCFLMRRHFRPHNLGQV